MAIRRPAHQNLYALVREKKFREDLYYRISTIALRVPPLRERREDIPPLARSLPAKLTAERGRPTCELSSDAEQALQNHRWPGNRLQQVILRRLQR